jgi:hypothetical protein
MLLSVGSLYRSGMLPCIGRVLAFWFLQDKRLENMHIRKKYTEVEKCYETLDGAEKERVDR